MNVNGLFLLAFMLTEHLTAGGSDFMLREPLAVILLSLELHVFSVGQVTKGGSD